MTFDPTNVLVNALVNTSPTHRVKHENSNVVIYTVLKTLGGICNTCTSLLAYRSLVNLLVGLDSLP